MLLPSLLILFCTSATNGFLVSKISALTNITPGSGMDKPSISFFGFSNGGEFSMILCSDSRCCETGKLNTEDNNWELGQVDVFVGAGQIGGCHNFRIGSDLSLILQHYGNNAGMLDWVNISSWRQDTYWHCEVGVDLDYSNSHTTQCNLRGQPRSGNLCNGASEFCALRVDQFLWAGTHNSGTGQAPGSATCAFKNQDLDVVGQLELGIRFFDIDTIYSTGLSGCHGLETGHGPNPDLGLYQCFGLVEDLLFQMGNWLDEHPTELVVLDFGNIEWPIETVPRLVATLRSVFPAEGNKVRMNTWFKKNGSWPLLGEAVTSNERIFVFIRDTVGAVSEDDLEFVKEIKVKPGRGFSTNKTDSEVYITTSYKAERVGECTYVLHNNRKACQSEMINNTDFLKLSLFSKFGKGGTLGFQCLHKMAKKCNRWVEGSIRNCNFKKFRPSMILLDYPNYQGQSSQGFAQLVEKENYKRAKRLQGEI